MDVVLPRPLGLVLKEDVRRQRVVVEDFVPGSHADKLAKVGQHKTLLPLIPQLCPALHDTLPETSVLLTCMLRS